MSVTLSTRLQFPNLQVIRPTVQNVDCIFFRTSAAESQPLCSAEDSPSARAF